ncbi:MAG: hypothetical protein CVU89_01645 [Firmicutes bacterium HGW-Firmicutes-14]|nr:MAG: hypothetical protein CVU89_01645 [Firmicutes bacterium HGW-Firmicutes-14]
MTTYEVTRTQHSGTVWSLPPGLLNRFKLMKGESVTLKFGSSRAETAVLPLDSALGPHPVNNVGLSKMGFSPELLKCFGIPDGTSLMIKPKGSRVFRLGPLVGVLAFSRHVPEKLGFYHKYAHLFKNRGILYIFSGKDIDLNTKTIQGYYFDHGYSTWKQGRFPFPDSVINRIYPESAKIHGLIEAVIGPGRIFNNKTSISKSDFIRTLGSDKLLKNHIPDTRLLKTVSDLTEQLIKHKNVYLKPVNSMKGKGIILVKQTDGGLECRFRKGTEDVTRFIASAAEITDVLRSATSNKYRYQVQQAINCMEFHGGPFSIRTCPMKNGKNQWVLPGMVVIGPYGDSPITNYSAGGKRIPLKELFKEIIPKIPYKKEDFLGLIGELTLRTAGVLDERFGPLGELGIDLVVDKLGKPWLLEANGNPARTPAFIQTEFPLWRGQLYRYLTDYSVYLAGFST